MLKIAFIKIRDVRILAIAIKIDIFLRIAGRQPCILHADADVLCSGRKRTTLRPAHPVVTIVGDSANEFVLGYDFFCRFQVLHKPILRSHWTWSSRRRVVLVIIHEHKTVCLRRDRRIVVVFASGLDADVQLHAFGMQILRQLTQERDVPRLCPPGKSLEIHHEATVFVRSKEGGNLSAKIVARILVVQECADVHPVDPVKVIDHGKYFCSGFL